MKVTKRQWIKKVKAVAVLCLAVTALSQCGQKSGSGSRETQPDFDERSSVFTPGRRSAEFFENCFNLPPGEIAEFVGWMAAAVKLEGLSRVCRGLSQAGFSDGVSTTRDPADIN